VKGARHAFAESAGRNMANPTAILLCASNMLAHIGLTQQADRIRNAVKATIRARKVGTVRSLKDLFYHDNAYVIVDFVKDIGFYNHL